jgi:hypothetical protein
METEQTPSLTEQLGIPGIRTLDLLDKQGSDIMFWNPIANSPKSLSLGGGPTLYIEHTLTVTRRTLCEKQMKTDTGSQ